MRQRFGLLIFTAALSGACTPAEPETSKSSGGTREHARAGLIADVARVVPGASFELAVRLEMDEHWHVYWTNPGESGLATEVRVRAPEGFEVGPVRFPGPARLVAAGDIVTYGYEDEVLLPVRVTAPADPGPGPFRFAAEVAWLVCEDGGSCIPGEAVVELELAAADDGAPGLGEHAEAFAKLKPRLPRAWDELDARPQTSWEGPADAPRLTIALDGAELEFFPDANPGLFLKSRQPGPGRLVLDFDHEPEAGSMAPPRVQGLLRVRQANLEGFYRFDMERQGS